ncbi:MAG: helix-turn-helix transcriptional regulator, partial [Chloroflexi bacterium]|nr:helix-turn-helix transcriptional regulator [Chloroflexota bacterium]
MTQMSPEKITRQALELIDREGSAFSMRRLGKALGVDAKAVYYYFPSKDKLIDAVLQHALTEMVLPDFTGLS